MIRKLRKKFVFSGLCAVLLVLFLIFGVLNIVNFHMIVTQSDLILKVIAQNQGEIPPEPDGPEDAAPPEDDSMEGAPTGQGEEKTEPSEDIPPQEDQDVVRIVENLLSISSETRYEIRFFSAAVDADGTVGEMNLSSIASVSEEEALEKVQAVYEGGRASGFFENYRFCRYEEDGTTWIVFMNMERSLSSVRSLCIFSVGVMLLGEFLALLILLLFSGRIFRPVAESYEKQRRFITDAGHEIKTPLTIIDANTEVLEMEIGENEWTQSTRNQIRRLAEMTGKLIALSRMDETENRIHKKNLRLGRILEETADSYTAPARTQEKEIRLEREADPEIQGDESSLRQLFSLLFDNAVKYSPARSVIRARLWQKGRTLHFTIENEAGEIPKGNMDRLFERFYRLDTSRNSRLGGSGIGLSVARSIVLSHKGKISAYSDGHSLCIHVELPVGLRASAGGHSLPQ